MGLDSTSSGAINSFLVVAARLLQRFFWTGFRSEQPGEAIAISLRTCALSFSRFRYFAKTIKTSSLKEKLRSWSLISQGLAAQPKSNPVSDGAPRGDGDLPCSPWGISYTPVRTSGLSHHYAGNDMDDTHFLLWRSQRKMWPLKSIWKRKPRCFAALADVWKASPHQSRYRSKSCGAMRSSTFMW